MHPFNQALLQREAELLSSLRDVAAEEAATAGFPVMPPLEQPVVGRPAMQAPVRWEVVGTPRGELLAKRIGR